MSGTGDDVLKNDKSMVVAALLCLFLGGLGMHRFYAGKVGTGILAMAMSGLGVILIVVGFAAAMAGASAGIFVVAWIDLATLGLWLLIDFIRIVMGKFKDKAGRPITSS